MRSNEEIMRSAEIVAAVRTLGARERDPLLRNPDYLAKHFLGLKWRLIASLPPTILRWYLRTNKPGAYYCQLFRTKFCDEILEEATQDGIQQFVILGAGNDTRPYRFQSQLTNTRIFELDFPGTQALKKKKLKKLYGSVPNHVTYVPIDFNSQSIEKVLLKSGYNKNLKTFFNWEGVSYYLPESAVIDVLQFISGNSLPGSSLFFDYSLRSFVEGDHTTYGGENFAKFLKRVKEPFLFGLNKEETTGFLNRQRLESVLDLGPLDLEKKYLNGNSRNHTYGHFRMVHARVQA